MSPLARFTRTAALLAVVAAMALPAAASAQDAVTFYGPGERAAFDVAVVEAGLALAVDQDFEDAQSPPIFGLVPNPLTPPAGTVPDPLDAASDNTFFDPGDIAPDLAFQSNAASPGLDGPQPLGPNGLVVSRPSVAGTHETQITIGGGTGGTGASLDILNSDPARTAFALDASVVEFSFVEPGTIQDQGLELAVFDDAGTLLGTLSIAREDIGPFVGFTVPEGTAVGRVNVSSPEAMSELLHGLEAYATGATPPERPGTNPLCGLLPFLPDC